MKPVAIIMASMLASPACSPPSPAGDAAQDASSDAATDAIDVFEDTGPVAQPVTVMTTRGGVIGRDVGTHSAFLGIPYAASTGGANRWRPPVERDPWTTPIDAATQPDACPQNPDGPGGALATSEDCLRVNVWTPSLAPATPRPVMVFVHGGGFTSGEIRNPLYQGANLAQHGVVAVSMSYRLGQFGWLAHPALVAEDTQHHAAGNYGFMDQQAALRWIQANIARFGGDPANVTLFGESAGAISVCGHLVAPQSDGLFHRAIAQSGSCAFIYLPLHDVPGAAYEGAEALGARFASALGCDTAADPLACMRAKPVADVLAAARAPLDLRSTGARYWPVVDGYLFPENPWTALRLGHVHHVPVIVGSNRDEGQTFTLLQPVTSVTQLEALAHVFFPGHETEALAPYPASAFANLTDRTAAFITDAAFACPARALARHIAAAGVASYLYQFTRVNIFGTRLGIGVFHGSEIPYVLSNFVSPFTANAGDRALSTEVVGYWTRFAASGDPGGAGAMAWSAYTTAGDTYIDLGDTVTVRTGLRRATCDVLEPLLDAR